MGPILLGCPQASPRPAKVNEEMVRAGRRVRPPSLPLPAPSSPQPARSPQAGKEMALCVWKCRQGDSRCPPPATSRPSWPGYGSHTAREPQGESLWRTAAPPVSSRPLTERGSAQSCRPAAERCSGRLGLFVYLFVFISYMRTSGMAAGCCRQQCSDGGEGASMSCPFFGVLSLMPSEPFYTGEMSAVEVQSSQPSLAANGANRCTASKPG